MKTVNMPNVKNIGQSSFSYCSKLSSMELGNNLTIIKSKAFYGCKSVKALDLPDSLETIEPASFKNCMFEHVSFGIGMKKIASTSFDGTVFKNLEGKTIKTAAELRGNVFDGSSGILFES